MPPSTSAQALQDLYGFRQNRKKTTDFLTEAENKLGLPSARQRQMGLRGAITNTENLIRNVDPSVTGRTQGQLVTEAQRQAIVNEERAPLADQFREQSRALEGETESLNQLSNRALSESQLGVSEQDSQERFLNEIYKNLLGKEEADRAYNLQVRQLEEQINQNRKAANQYAGVQAALEKLLNQPPAASNQPQVVNPTPLNPNDFNKAVGSGAIKILSSGGGDVSGGALTSQALNSGGLGTVGSGQRGLLQRLGSWINPFG